MQTRKAMKSAHSYECLHDGIAKDCPTCKHVNIVIAAPAMLELFKRGLECGIFHDSPIYRRDVKAVIAKAEGRTEKKS